MPCPVCQDIDCEELGPAGDYHAFDCVNCGKFGFTGSLYKENFVNQTPTMPERIALAKILARHSGQTPLKIDSYSFHEFVKNARVPSSYEISRDLIRFIGDHYKQTAEPLADLSQTQMNQLGCPDEDTKQTILQELEEKKLLAKSPGKIGWYLSMDGWQLYDDLNRGNISGKNAFIAMKFGEADLDDLLQYHIKPSVKEKTGYEVIRLDEILTAGIIDNQLRNQIRDAAFVIADLTHANNGAYWEAGYAEGLGKPVIYICERAAFEEKKTHFDTNHCTTIMWDTEHKEKFKDELVATIQLTLGRKV